MSDWLDERDSGGGLLHEQGDLDWIGTHRAVHPNMRTFKRWKEASGNAGS